MTRISADDASAARASALSARCARTSPSVIPGGTSHAPRRGGAGDQRHRQRAAVRRSPRQRRPPRPAGGAFIEQLLGGLHAIPVTEPLARVHADVWRNRPLAVRRRRRPSQPHIAALVDVAAGRTDHGPRDVIRADAIQPHLVLGVAAESQTADLDRDRGGQRRRRYRAASGGRTGG